MSIDNVHREKKAKKDISSSVEDITYDRLAEATESEIAAHKQQIEKLRKSLIFFRKQAAQGVEFPTKGRNRHGG